MADGLQDCSAVLKLIHCMLHGVLRHLLAKQVALTYRSEIEGMMAILVRGDAMSKEDVAKAFDQIEEVDAVVSTIGGTPADPTADSQVIARTTSLQSTVQPVK